MKRISVLSLNLRFGLADDGPNAWDYRKESVVKLFKGQSPDLIATQEANHFQIDFLAENLSEYRYIGRRHPAPKFWQDNILFYRKTIVCQEDVHFFLSQTPHIPSRSFESRYPRQATLGLFHLNGEPLICIDTHFDFEAPAQMGAARVIKDHLSSYGDEIPTILMGDFNATPESLCYQWLTGKTLNGLDFNETFKKPYPSTFHCFTGEPTGGYIDWILYRKPLGLSACEVLQGPIDGIYPSDHFPVRAVFEL
ncbi:MAG: endonuclease/exonuclease/phosphatase family protein [Deltaproteobacteria bacterium]|nr:endonuclease/exonuclease/phosphatase family protein [Deltaproteobacteria bacterium]MBW2019917.1 endonuclease/exonuclease/phosphatase family protein [Deltaproteobacteria bacterium]MBW2074544.1 endonuclease/exonuclease/phosphatase family protein [Deltaproteobacteria bacterium]RLB80549.1 MAG: metal-dependent hydrolase [Deltaproteobacteria bacterium]